MQKEKYTNNTRMIASLVQSHRWTSKNILCISIAFSQ